SATARRPPPDHGPVFGPAAATWSDREQWCGHASAARRWNAAGIPGEGGLRRRGDGLVGIGGRCRVNGCWRRCRLLPELDPDRAQPATDVPIDRRGAERDLFVEDPVGRVEDERPRLEPTQPTVRADQLLERSDLAELRVILADEQQIRRVLHRVLAAEAEERVGSERLRRVLALD